jgi:hypothetical protein
VKTKHGKIRRSFNCANFLTDGMILFLEIPLILCKQLVHMYDVGLGFVWKYVESYFDNLFKKYLSCF